MNWEEAAGRRVLGCSARSVQGLVFTLDLVLGRGGWRWTLVGACRRAQSADRGPSHLFGRP